jgi:flagellar biosynthetic protein FliQ/type III secretion protein S
MTLGALLADAQQALVLSIAVALPALAVAAIVGLLTGALQAATQVQDPAVAHLPRLVAVAAALAVLGPWMGREIVAFAARMFAGG